MKLGSISYDNGEEAGGVLIMGDRWLFILVFVCGLLIAVGLQWWNKRKQGDDDLEEAQDLSLKEQMLMGTSVVPPKPEPKPEEEKTLMEKVYSGKGRQPQYMRYMAQHERERAVQAAKLAEEKERQNRIDE